MIFYKDKLCSVINKNSLSKEDANKNTKQFVKNIINYFKKCFRDINLVYVYKLLCDDKNNIAFYCMDTNFNIDNCPASIIYQKKQNTKEITYYILLIFTVTKFRNLGYASIMLDEFIKSILKKHKSTSSNKIKFVLSSTEKAFDFYVNSGFILTPESLEDHNILSKYEKFDKTKMYYIFELLINSVKLEET